MTPVILWAALVVLGLSSANGAVTGPVSLSELAPADDYFGRLKMSPLEIRHKIFSLKYDLHRARLRPDAITHAALLVDDALHDWAARFPSDPWLPPTVWNLATLYEELPGTDAQSHAIATLQFIRSTFASTTYAQLASRDLSRGIGVRPWPHWAGKPVKSILAAATPAPSTTATATHPPTHAPSHAPAATPSSSVSPDDAASLVAATLAHNDLQTALALEERYWTLSKDGNDAAYTRAAWQLAALYERLPGDSARDHAIRLLALLVDRYPQVVYGRWALRDLARGIGSR